MEGQLPLHSEGVNASRTPPPNLPPWEVRAVSQVPYCGRSPTPPSTNSEVNQYQRSRGLRSGSESENKPRLVTTNSAPTRAEYSSPVSQKSAHWSKRRHTNAFPPAQLGPAPYETPLDLPADAGNIRHRTFLPAANPPPSPPDSPYSCNKSDASVSRDVPAQALPGTMSSRASHARARSRSRSLKTHDRESTTRSQSEHKPFGKRFTSAFRGIFRKEPVDESSFEHISDRHWTDEP